MAQERAEDKKRGKIRIYLRIIILVMFLIYMSVDFWHFIKMCDCAFTSLLVTGLGASLILALIEENWSFPVKVADYKYKEYVPEILAEEETNIDEYVEETRKHLEYLQEKIEETKRDLDGALSSRLIFTETKNDVKSQILKEES